MTETRGVSAPIALAAAMLRRPAEAVPPPYLEAAVRRACDGAWRALEIALAGDLLRSRLGRTRDGNVAYAVVEVLHAVGAPVPARANALAALRGARRAGRLDGEFDVAAVIARCSETGDFDPLPELRVVLADAPPLVEALADPALGQLLRTVARALFRLAAVHDPTLQLWAPLVDFIAANTANAAVTLNRLLESPASIAELDRLIELPHALDDNVQFTVYRPRAIEPARWHPLLVFAHVAERRPGEDAALDPIEEVRRQAEAVLGERAADYGALTQDAGAAIPTDGELVLVPEVEGVEFHPRRRSFLWLEPVHREEFLIRAGADMLGRTARGRLTVFLGHLAIAELALTMRVEAARAQAPAEASHARTYRRIFASYSHRDAAIVEQVEQYARAIGDEYVRDALHLRSGQVWNDRLREMIEQADAFQLFWSWASMQSAFVRQEYEHALALNRASFVRPTYWEDPMPSAPDNPPSSLSRLHFQRIQLAIPAIPPLDGVRAAPRGSSPYATVCARCGTSNPLHDKFCLTCGAGLQAPPSVGDMMIPRDVSHMGKSTPPRGTPIVPSAVLVELGPPRTADPGAEAFGMDAAGRARDAFAPAPPQAQAPRRSPTRPGSAPQSTGQRQTDGPTYFELPEASKKRRAPWIAGGSVALLTVVGFVLLSVHGGHPPDPIPDNPDANREAILRKERGQFELLLREERQHDAAIAQAKAEIDRARLETEVQAAKVRLESLQRQQRELTERMQSARNAAAKAALRAGVHISDECLANPLASGCL